MADPLVSLRSVALHKPGSLILRSVDLDLQPGSATALFGSNGSGKTTLLRVVATLLRPTSGTATILGTQSDAADLTAIRRRIGLVGHESTLLPNLTLGENLQLAASIALQRPAATEAAETLASVGLAGASDRRAGRSSNGMKRRVEFARMLVTRPDVLLLDEAHVGLDPDAWNLVAHLVSEVTDRGGCALIVAHEQERIRPFVDRSVTLRDGSLEAS